VLHEIATGSGQIALPPQESRAVMSATDKASNKADELKGQAKEAAGKATGDEGLEAEGKGDQGVANLKQAGEKVKDAFRG
jgi:uncharacterized protein YjbJ (UPF0337 family)